MLMALATKRVYSDSLVENHEIFNTQLYLAQEVTPSEFRVDV